ncbi:exo-alpha-sialidase [Paenibacillus flagellatus]|uniref:F5/8 type C domain-containing protein n=1 Tax=Paenibacillus flagellatus TaxID=2211139 RepID=A0A2V5KDW0_9BACL|nr:exo-alpha-sialidase [Paenibacillus flagellatus]PYI56193.1 hypothetical protein DLM86_04175 [Paenibacillus flagellatus]
MKAKQTANVVIVLVICLLAAVWSPAPASAITSVTEPDVIVASETVTEGTYFPSMALLDDGRLLVVYYSAAAHEKTDGRIKMVESSDYGQTWSQPRVILDTPNNIDDRDPSIAQISDGTLILSWFTFNNATQERRVWVSRSTDGGATWSAAIPVGTNLAATSAVTSKVVELDNGDLLLPIYGQYVSKSHMPVSTAVRSTDGGLTWNASTEVVLANSIPEEFIGFVEPVIVNLGGGHLYSLHRTLNSYDDYYAWESHSYDNGYTWTPAARTLMKAHCSDLLLLSNNMLLHTWGDRSFRYSGGRPVQGKAIPVGADWSMYTDIPIYTHDGKGDMAYPSAVELPDGTIFLVYYDADRGFIGGTYTTVSEMSVEEPGTKLDLLALFNSGRLQVETDMTMTRPPVFSNGAWSDGTPETGIRGAIDGGFYSFSYRGTATPPVSYYKLTFDEPVTMNAFGLSLRPPYSTNATVYYSGDGVNWTLLHAYPTSVHKRGYLNTIEMTTPVTAKAIRIEIGSSSKEAGISEIAVYGSLPTPPPPSPASKGAKIDLLQMYNDGDLLIDTDMTHATANFGITGPIDGVKKYGYSATRGSAAPPTAHYTIDLGAPRTLSAIGVNLKPGYEQDAVVYTSLDGTNWLPVKVYNKAKPLEGLMDYRQPGTPREAKYVKVEITKSEGWPLLSELELYEIP